MNIEQPLAAGTLLENRYRIRGLLGQGGMSRVYLAEDMRLGVHVAVKENLQDTQEARKQFEQEAHLLARLAHPNIPRVLDVFTEMRTQRQYLVMEYIEGEDLAAMIKRVGPLPEAMALAWIRQILDAVEYLHAQNPPVIHRDIKPANIKITPQGKAVLVDFGIAKFYDPSRGTMTGMPAVTAGYAPPEQYGFRTTQRSDIYALGATLYTVLTGKVPPDAPLRQAGEEVLIPPRQLAPISEHTENVILRALEVDNTRRWQSVSELRAALEGKIAASKITEESKTVYIPKQGVVSKSKDPRRPSSRVIMVAMGVIAIAVCLLILGIWRATGSRMIALIQTVTPTPTNTATPTFTPSIRTVTSTALPDAVSEVMLLLFTGPGYAYDYREIISAGERLQVLARSSQTGDWLLVTTSQGKSGWVPSTLVKVNIPLSAVPVAAQLSPTPMLRPPVTPTPGVRLPYKDDFSNPASGWSVGSGTSCASSYEKGEYHIVVKVENMVCWASRVSDDPQGFSDFSLQVMARRVEGSNGTYGLIFRERVDNDNKTDAYFFRIHSDGYYALHKLVQSEWITLIPWTASSYIKTGSATNILKVTARGAQITIFVNGQQLGSTTDATFSRGRIGVLAGSFQGETNFRVAFDDFEVTSVP